MADALRLSAAAVSALLLPLVTSWAQVAVVVLLVALASWAAIRARRDGRRVPLRVPDHAADVARLINADPDLIVFSVDARPGPTPGRPSLAVTLSEGGGLARVGLRPGEAVGSCVEDWPAEDAANYYRALAQGAHAWVQPYPSDPRDPSSAPRTFAYVAVRDARGGLSVRVIDVTEISADRDRLAAELAEAEQDLAAIRPLVEAGLRP